MAATTELMLELIFSDAEATVFDFADKLSAPKDN